MARQYWAVVTDERRAFGPYKDQDYANTVAGLVREHDKVDARIVELTSYSVFDRPVRTPETVDYGA